MTAPVLLIFGVFWYGLVLVSRHLTGTYWLWGMQAYVLGFGLGLLDWGLLGVLQWQYGSKDRTLRSYFFAGDSTWSKRFAAVILLGYGALLWLVWTGHAGPLAPGDVPPGDLTAAIRGPDAEIARWKIFFHYTPLVILAPITEEFLFRGLLLTYLKQRWDRRIAWGATTQPGASASPR